MLRVLGIAFITLIIAAAMLIGAGYLAEKRARAFSEQAAREIFTDWNYDAARRLSMKRLRLSPRMNAEGPKTFQWGKAGLGSLQAAGQPLGGIAIRWGKMEDPHWLYGNYEFDARFDKAQANLQIGLIWEDRAWRISNYRFDSSVLHDPPLPSRPAN